jgi:hypothetical protein
MRRKTMMNGREQLYELVDKYNCAVLGVASSFRDVLRRTAVSSAIKII